MVMMPDTTYSRKRGLCFAHAKALLLLSLTVNADTLTFIPSDTPGVTNYSIYHGPASHVQTNRVDLGPATEWLIQGVLPKTPSFFFATAWANGVESDPSNEVAYTNLTEGRLAILDSQFDRYTNANTWNNLTIKRVAFDTNSCAFKEGCVTGAGLRKLLGLKITIFNPSTEPSGIWVGPEDQSLYSYDSCHNHVHLQNFSSFELLSFGGVVASGRKIGWCVQSLYRISDLIWNTNATSGDCWTPRMDPGWADTYQFEGQPCMYLDITDVPDGYYTLRITIDPLRLFANAHDSISQLVRIQGDVVTSFVLGSVVALKVVVERAADVAGPYLRLTNEWFHEFVGLSNLFFRARLEISQ